MCTTAEMSLTLRDRARTSAVRSLSVAAVGTERSAESGPNLFDDLGVVPRRSSPATACMTVVWLRPPKAAPIAGSLARCARVRGTSRPGAARRRGGAAGGEQLVSGDVVVLAGGVRDGESGAPSGAPARGVAGRGREDLGGEVGRDRLGR